MEKMKMKYMAKAPSQEGACCFKLLLLIVVLCLFLCSGGCSCLKRSDTAGLKPGKENGIEVKSVNISAAGYMLDFRYVVTDAAKAKPFFDRGIKPYVIDQKTNARLTVPSPPKVGPLTQTSNPPQKGKTYFIFFANPGKLVKSGDKITVVMDDMELKDIAVN